MCFPLTVWGMAAVVRDRQPPGRTEATWTSHADSLCGGEDLSFPEVLKKTCLQLMLHSRTIKDTQSNMYWEPRPVWSCLDCSAQKGTGFSPQSPQLACIPASVYSLPFIGKLSNVSPTFSLLTDSFNSLTLDENGKYQFIFVVIASHLPIEINKCSV